MARQLHRLVAPQFTPLLPQWRDAGVYQLWLRVNGPVVLRVGGLGRLHFAPGTYVYTGLSARGLRRRVLCHVRGAEHFHWHMTTFSPVPRARHTVNLPRRPVEECRVNRAAGAVRWRRYSGSARPMPQSCPAPPVAYDARGACGLLTVALSGGKECK